MHRRRLAAFLNDGFSVMVSDLALISLEPIFASFAHDGIRPQRTDRSCRTASASGSSFGGRSSTVRTVCVGVTL